MMLVSLISLALAAVSPAPSTALGVWKTPVDEGLVRLESCGADLCGRTVGSVRLRAFPGQKDARNRDAALRERPLMGLIILRLHAIGQGHWGGGTVYNPNDGGTYNAELWVTDTKHVRLRGCLVAPLCRTQIWTRVA